jgi:hypothetical protein
MKPENFENDYQILINEMELRMNKPAENRTIITDGVMNVDDYFLNDIRLAWMLKEPYDEEDGTGGGWSYFEMFKGENLYLEQFNRAHKVTWHPIIYVSYGIMNNFTKWSELDYIRDNHKMCDVVRNVAFINSQKLPSKNVTRTDFNDLFESITQNSDLLNRQVNLLNPNVLIFGNTFNLYTNILKINVSDLIEYENGIKYIVKDEKLYISTYHPAQTQITRDLYVDGIISLVEKWKKKKL